MVSVILPAYEEAENLKELIPELKLILKENNIENEIIVVDSMNNIDETKSICIENGIIHINRLNGDLYGDAIRTGIFQSKGDEILFMDADGSHSPKDMVKLIKKYYETDADIVIGSRYIKGGYTDNNFILKFMSYTLNITYRFIFKLNIRDVSNSFRIYNACNLKSIELRCDNFDIVEEMLIRLKLKFNDMKIIELPISFNKRKFGESKRDLLKFVVSYMKTMKKLYKIQKGKE